MQESRRDALGRHLPGPEDNDQTTTPVKLITATCHHHCHHHCRHHYHRRGVSWFIRSRVTEWRIEIPRLRLETRDEPRCPTCLPRPLQALSVLPLAAVWPLPVFCHLPELPPPSADPTIGPYFGRTKISEFPELPPASPISATPTKRGTAQPLTILPPIFASPEGPQDG